MEKPFSQLVDNLPFSIKEIKINKNKLNLLKKIPFSCKIINFHDGKEIFI